MSDVSHIGDWTGPMSCFLCGADLDQNPDSEEQISGRCLRCLHGPIEPPNYAAKVEAGTATMDDHCDVMIEAIQRADPFAPPVTIEYIEQMRELSKPSRYFSG